MQNHRKHINYCQQSVYIRVINIDLALCTNYKSKQYSIPSVLHGLSDIASCLIHSIHHTSISPVIFIFNKAVFVYILLWSLEWSMDILECHVQKQRSG